MSAKREGVIIQMRKGEKRKLQSEIDWHSGFAGGLELVFRDYRDQITIEREHSLSKQPLRIDFLLIKVNPGVFIDNDIGRLFKTHNIIEYKNPYAALNIDVVWKVVGYAALYKGLGHRANEIPYTEITISIFRHSKPIALLDLLVKNGYKIINPNPGIYEISGLIDIPLYIIVSKELTKKDFTALRIMTKNADVNDIKAFITEASYYSLAGDKNNADAVLQVSTSANKATFEILKGDESDMCEALRELMADELKQEFDAGAAQKELELVPIIKEKDKAISEKNKAISEKDATINDLAAQLKKFRDKYGDI